MVIGEIRFKLFFFSVFIATSASLYANPIEAIVIGVLALFGLSLFGIPLLLMLMSMYNMNVNPGVSMIPTATANVNSGRRKRSSEGNVNQYLISQALETFNSFVNSKDKIRLLQELIS